MHRFRTMLAALLVLVMAVAAVPAQAAPAPKTDVAKQMAKVEAFRKAVSIVKADTVDWAALREVYRTGLQPTVRSRDTEFGEQLDVTLEAAINAGEAGELSKKVVAQMVDKLLQKVFYLTIKHEFIEAKEKLAAGDKAGALHHIDEAIAYFEALRTTVQKRDKAFGTTLEAQIDAALETAQQAVEAGDEELLYLMQPGVTHNLVITFYLATSGYAEKIEAGVAAGEDESHHMAEGWAFFQAIKGNVGKETPDLATFVEERFNPVKGDQALVNARELQDAMTAGLLGYVIHEAEEVEEQWDALKRFHVTAEGAVVAKGLISEVADLLGADVATAFEQHVDQWVAAVRADDKEGAIAHATEVEKIALQAQEQLIAAPAGAVVLTAGRATVKADGKWQVIDVAPKAEGADLAIPIRFAAEALGYDVSWDEATRTVTIAGNGKTVVLTIGGETITADGQRVSVSYKPYIENDRTYVPASFLEEFLGASYEWNAAAQSITIAQ